MANWELSTLYVPHKIEYKKAKKAGVDIPGRLLFSRPDQASQEVWQQAQKLAAEGWELVEAIPDITGHVLFSGSMGTSCLAGYYLIFKRERLV